MNIESLPTGISSSNISEEFLLRLVRNNITYYELSVGDLPGAEDIDWRSLKNNAAKTGITLWSYHLPFYPPADISDFDKNSRAFAVKADFELIKKAADIGIKNIVIHPSFEPIEDSERSLKMAVAKESLSRLADLSASCGATLCVEDLPRTCLGRDASEMFELLSANENLRVCFDVNHLLLSSGCDHKMFVKAVGDKIVTAHMSDYDFTDEKHFFCGNGLIDWNLLSDLLEECSYSGPFLFEGGFSPSIRMPNVPFGTVEQAHERHMNIRSFRGKNILQ